MYVSNTHAQFFSLPQLCWLSALFPLSFAVFVELKNKVCVYGDISSCCPAVVKRRKMLLSVLSGYKWILGRPSDSIVCHHTSAERRAECFTLAGVPMQSVLQGRSFFHYLSLPLLFSIASFLGVRCGVTDDSLK